MIKINEINNNELYNYYKEKINDKNYRYEDNGLRGSFFTGTEISRVCYEGVKGIADTSKQNIPYALYKGHTLSAYDIETWTRVNGKVNYRPSKQLKVPFGYGLMIFCNRTKMLGKFINGYASGMMLVTDIFGNTQREHWLHGIPTSWKFSEYQKPNFTVIEPQKKDIYKTGDFSIDVIRKDGFVYIGDVNEKGLFHGDGIISKNGYKYEGKFSNGEPLEMEQVA